MRDGVPNEWRIGLEPKPYAESLGLLVPVVEAWCRMRDSGWLVGNAPDDGNFMAQVTPGCGGCVTENAETPATALAKALLAAMEKEEAISDGD